MSNFCTFDAALERAARIIRGHLPRTEHTRLRLVRDMTGRVLVVVPDEVDDETLKSLRTELAEQLGPYLFDPEGSVARVSDTLAGEELLAEPALAHTVDGAVVLELERRVVGQDWVLAPTKFEGHPPRVTFFSLKGGVGRSTALFLWGRRLVEAGRTVLLVDVDLEAPGLGTQLLGKEERPTYGVLDWLVEDLVGNPELDRVVGDMYSACSLVRSPGLIVVPAVGKATDGNPAMFVSKLARAYLERDEDDRPAGFATRLRQLLVALEGRVKPDVVLIDSRAGVHETAAATILHLDADVMLFATDQPAVWEGYSYLLSHLRLMAQSGWAPSAEDWRLRLKMVHAKAPAAEAAARRFLERSYELWLSTLYDEVPAEAAADGFSFDMEDEAAPHYPLTVLADERFERFNPLEHLSQVGEEAVEAVLRRFALSLEERVLGSENDD